MTHRLTRIATAMAATLAALSAQAAPGSDTPVTDARLANPSPPTGCCTAATTRAGPTARWTRAA